MEKAVCKIINLFLSKGICNHPVRCRRNLCNEVCISGSRHILRSLCSNLRVEDHSIRSTTAEGLLVAVLGNRRTESSISIHGSGRTDNDVSSAQMM